VILLTDRQRDRQTGRQTDRQTDRRAGNRRVKHTSLAEVTNTQKCRVCLKFHLHVNHIVSSAFTRDNIILKCFKSRNVQILLRAFKVYVLPIIEYAFSVSVLLTSLLISVITKVQSVQRKFTKRLPDCSHLSYPDRLVRLNLDSLVVRRLRPDLIVTYKIVFGLTDMNPDNFFTFANSIYNTRGHAYKLLPSHCRANVRMAFLQKG